MAVPVVNPICLKKLKWTVKHICKKRKRIVITNQHLSIKNYKQIASCFHCSAPRTPDDMFAVDNIEYLEKVSKTLTNMCQEDIDVLNIQGFHPRSCIMHFFPIIPMCARPFMTNKDEPFDDYLTCQLSEIIKGMKPNAKDLQRFVFRINSYNNNGKKRAGILLRVMRTRQ